MFGGSDNFAVDVALLPFPVIAPDPDLEDAGDGNTEAPDCCVRCEGFAGVPALPYNENGGNLPVVPDDAVWPVEVWTGCCVTFEGNGGGGVEAGTELLETFGNPLKEVGGVPMGFDIIGGVDEGIEDSTVPFV